MRNSFQRNSSYIPRMIKQRARKPSSSAQAERIIRARTAGRSVRSIAEAEGMTEAGVDTALDCWVAGLIGPKLREREYALLLERNDELIQALRPKALEARNLKLIAAYSAAMSRRATLLALRPPNEAVIHHVLAESTPKAQTGI